MCKYPLEGADNKVWNTSTQTALLDYTDHNNDQIGFCWNIGVDPVNNTDGQKQDVMLALTLKMELVLPPIGTRFSETLGHGLGRHLRWLLSKPSIHNTLLKLQTSRFGTDPYNDKFLYLNLTNTVTGGYEVFTWTGQPIQHTE